MDLFYNISKKDTCSSRLDYNALERNRIMPRQASEMYNTSISISLMFLSTAYFRANLLHFSSSWVITDFSCTERCNIYNLPPCNLYCMLTARLTAFWSTMGIPVTLTLLLSFTHLDSAHTFHTALFDKGVKLCYVQ